MKKYLPLLIAALLPACCTVIAPKAQDANHLTMVEQLEYKTTALVHFIDGEGHEVDPDNPRGTDTGTLAPYCAGVWVNQTTMLTAEHCVDDIGRPPVSTTEDLEALLEALERNPLAALPKTSWTPDGQPVLYSTRDDIKETSRGYHRGIVVAVDMYNDLVLIEADVAGDHPIAHLSQAVIHDGDNLHIVGHPSGMWWTYVHGYVSAHRPHLRDNNNKEHDIMQVSAPVFFGNSGGGAFDIDGNLVGLADAIRTTGAPEVGVFVTRDVLRGFLEHNRIIAPIHR